MPVLGETPPEDHPPWFVGESEHCLTRSQTRVFVCPWCNSETEESALEWSELFGCYGCRCKKVYFGRNHLRDHPYENGYHKIELDVEDGKRILFQLHHKAVGEEVFFPFLASILDTRWGYIAVADSLVVGYCLWSNEPEDPTLDRLFVRPHARRTGVATNLIRTGPEFDSHFWIREPNEAALHLLEGMGRVKFVDDEPVCLDCTIIPE